MRWQTKPNAQQQLQLLLRRLPLKRKTKVTRLFDLIVFFFCFCSPPLAVLLKQGCGNYFITNCIFTLYFWALGCIHTIHACIFKPKYCATTHQWSSPWTTARNQATNSQMESSANLSNSNLSKLRQICRTVTDSTCNQRRSPAANQHQAMVTHQRMHPWPRSLLPFPTQHQAALINQAAKLCSHIYSWLFNATQANNLVAFQHTPSWLHT